MAQNYLKGVKHEFIKPLSESKFSGDVLVFRDSDKNPIEYSMNMRPGGRKTRTDVVNFEGGDNNFTRRVQRFKYQDIYFQNSDFYDFEPDLTEGYELKPGTVRLKINGVQQRTNHLDPRKSEGVDFSLDATLSKIRLYKPRPGDPYTDGSGATRYYNFYGYEIRSGSYFSDEIEVKYSQESM